MNIEIYVYDEDYDIYNIIDLFEDETINMELKLKDLNDISKVFSTFSQNFNIPATPNNNNIFRYYFDTNTTKYRQRTMNSKIYLNGNIYRTGQIIIKQGKVENYELLNYNVEFRTIINNIKDLVGDTRIIDIVDEYTNQDLGFQWNSQNVFNTIRESTGNENIIVPLVSTTRVWTYGDGSPSDIKLDSNAITIDELAPAIKVEYILNHILNYYGLDLDFPLRNKPAFKRLYMWLNSKQDDIDGGTIKQSFKFTKPWVLNSTGDNVFFTVSNVNGSMRIRDTGVNYRADRLYQIYVYLQNVQTAESLIPYTGKVKVILKNKNTGEELTVDKAEFTSLTNITFRIPQGRAGNVRDFDILFYFDHPIHSYQVAGNIAVLHWQNSNFPANSYLTTANIMTNLDNYFDLRLGLGDWKIIDFLSSIFKTFNIRVLENYNDYSMKWLTAKEFYLPEYVDYTEQTEVSQLTLMPSTNYKDFKFTPADEGYFRNKEYKKLVGKVYGSELYNSFENGTNDSYVVDTKFSILNWFMLTNTNLKTSYGFSSPNSQHNPSNPTIFYAEENKIIRTDDDIMNVNFRFKIPKPNNPNFTNQLAKYLQVGNADGSPQTYSNSITFDIDINPEQNKPMLKSLYNNYYRFDIERLYLPNSNFYIYEGYLTTPQIIDFDMRKLIKIENNLYTIEEANIDLLSGRITMKLFNYLNNIETLIPKEEDENVIPQEIIPPLPYINSVGGLEQISMKYGCPQGTIQTVKNFQIQTKLSHFNDSFYNNVDIPFYNNGEWNYSVNNLQQGYYTVRIRTVSPTFNTSDWVYNRDIYVSSSVVRPSEVIVTDVEEELPYNPCQFYAPTLEVRPWVVNKTIKLYANEPIENWKGDVQLFYDENLKTKFKPTNSNIIQQIGSIEGKVVVGSKINTDGFMEFINPCPTNVAVKVKVKEYGWAEYVDQGTYDKSPTVDLYTNANLVEGSKLFLDKDLKIVADGFMKKFDGKLVTAYFESYPNDTRYFKLEGGRIASVPTPIDFNPNNKVNSVTEIELDLSTKSDKETCGVKDTFGKDIIKLYSNEIIKEGVILYDSESLIKPFRPENKAYFLTKTNKDLISLYIDSNGTILEMKTC